MVPRGEEEVRIPTPEEQVEPLQHTAAHSAWQTGPRARGEPRGDPRGSQGASRLPSRSRLL